MIRSTLVKKKWSYEPVGETLQNELRFLQDKIGYEVINVIETKVNKGPGDDGQAFIIIYDTGESKRKRKRRPHIKFRRRDPNVCS